MNHPCCQHFLFGLGQSRLSTKGLMRLVAIGLMVMIVAVAVEWTPTTRVRAQTLPVNPMPTCTVPSSLFASWFTSGSVSLNGVVNPANSVTFPNPANNCPFYQWSEQMFLWLTSPTPRTYGGGDGRIFDSPVFFDVSPPDSSGNRTFIPHQSGMIRNFALRGAKVGKHGLPIVKDTKGRMIEIERPQLGPTGRQVILNKAGKQIEIERATFGTNHKPVFFDKAGKQIQLARPVVRAQLLQQKTVNKSLVAHRFIIDKRIVLLDLFGNVVDVEDGQAGGDGVLEAQYGSLVYYAITVNDVYAYFLTGVKDGAIPSPGGIANAVFPTTQANLNVITAFAAAHGKTFPDPNALAIEVKSSWVEASGLPNPGDYITMTATIPTYNKSNPNLWTPASPKTTKLALVGMHVVGSAAGHGEMIWASFEHFNNTPNATYSYINSSNVVQTINQSTAGSWLFSANNSSGPFNQVHMDAASPPNIESVTPPPPPPSPTPFPISASDTLRTKPFGAASDLKPNPLIASSAASNSQVISINDSVLGQLFGGDIRRNYFMIGSTWTIGGAAPTGSFPNGNEVGTSRLANSTMETYFQGINTLYGSGSNCFSCHGSNKVQVSHIFCDPSFPNCTVGLKPLF